MVILLHREDVYEKESTRPARPTSSSPSTATAPPRHHRRLPGPLLPLRRHGALTVFGQSSDRSPGVPAYAGDDFYCDVAIPYADRLDVVHHDERVLGLPPHPAVLAHAPRRRPRPPPRVAHLGDRYSDEADVRALLAVVQAVARRVETKAGRSRGYLTNLGRYQDSKHLHVHVHAGPTRK